MVYPENIGPYLSIDEIALSQGELYTFITNKLGRAKKGSMVGCVHGTRVNDIIALMSQIPLHERQKVQEITLDMANNMSLACKELFPNARLVTDRYHVVSLINEVVQEQRVYLRHLEMDLENKAIKEARLHKIRYKAEELANGDTPKQLLVRLRHCIGKSAHKLTQDQKLRLSVAFTRYPALERAYNFANKGKDIFNCKDKYKARKLLLEWMEEAMTHQKEWFSRVANTIEAHFESIMNFFNFRSTNAGAESFNAKIKLFRANLRGVKDKRFFLFRLEKLFA